MHILEYFSQYDAVFTQQEKKPPSSFSIPYIWQCWLQGKSSMPPLVQACIRSVQHHHAAHTIKFVDQDNVTDYVSIPAHIQKKYRQKRISPAHFSDYIRVALLAQYGGTWIDATVLFTEALPQHIFKQDFFAFSFPPWCQYASLPSPEIIFSDQTRAIDKRCFSNWFLHAKPHNRFLQVIKSFLENYWLHEDTAFNYFFFHLFCTYAVLKDAQCAQVFTNMPKINNAHAHLLQQCLLQPYDATVFAYIQKAGPIHKLTHKAKENFPRNSFGEFLEKNFKALSKEQEEKL